MGAIGRKRVKIYVVKANTSPSLLASSDIVAGEIVNYSKQGGGDDVESVPAFGGFIDKEKPREQVTLAFDVVPTIGVHSERWEAMSYASETVSTNTIYTMADSGVGVTLPTPKMIAIEAVSGTDYTTILFNNCDVTNYDIEHAAEDNRTGNITFKISPTTTQGVTNYAKAKLAATSMPAFSALANNPAQTGLLFFKTIGEYK